MDNIQGYIERANECMELAGLAENEQFRQRLIGIAAAWLQLAQDKLIAAFSLHNTGQPAER